MLRNINLCKIRTLHRKIHTQNQTKPLIDIKKYVYIWDYIRIKQGWASLRLIRAAYKFFKCIKSHKKLKYRILKTKRSKLVFKKSILSRCFKMYFSPYYPRQLQNRFGLFCNFVHLIYKYFNFNLERNYRIKKIYA